MSKIREQALTFGEELPPPTPDTMQWVVYTCKKSGAPYKWAGYVDAPDQALALQYAREHYGLDEACVGLIAHRHEDAIDSEYALTNLEPTDASGTDGDEWTVLTLNRRGGNHQTAGVVHAPNGKAALARAQASFAGPKVCNIRVVKSSQVLETNEEELLIWRHHDMSYKLARGYSKQVRSKWTRIRDEQTYEDYRQEDIADHF